MKVLLGVVRQCGGYVFSKDGRACVPQWVTVKTSYTPNQLPESFALSWQEQ